MKTTAHPTTIKVSRSIKRQGTQEQVSDDEPETFEVHQFATTPATVSISYPIKLSKNYQTAGITVGVTLPCYVEEVDAAFERATEIVVKKLKDEMPKLKSLLNKMAEENR